MIDLGFNEIFEISSTFQRYSLWIILYTIAFILLSGLIILLLLKLNITSSTKESKPTIDREISSLDNKRMLNLTSNGFFLLFLQNISLILSTGTIIILNISTSFANLTMDLIFIGVTSLDIIAAMIFSFSFLKVKRHINKSEIITSVLWFIIPFFIIGYRIIGILSQEILLRNLTIDFIDNDMIDTVGFFIFILCEGIFSIALLLTVKNIKNNVSKRINQLLQYFICLKWIFSYFTCLSITLTEFNFYEETFLIMGVIFAGIWAIAIPVLTGFTFLSIYKQLNVSKRLFNKKSKDYFIQS